MLTYEFLRLVAEEREREVQELIRIQRLIVLHDVASEASAGRPDEIDRAYAEPWRAKAPRASATTR